ncbi:MAG: carbohydrate kinase family protein [Actinomycetota bacterium]
MTLDLAVVGAPFFDLTFEGLERLPKVGEEVVARALHIAPGGTGTQALGAARLGLATALVAPIGADPVARLVRAVLESEGVKILACDGAAEDAAGAQANVGVPTTALLTTPRGVAMATALGGEEPRAEDVARVDVRAAMLSLGRLSLAPPGAAVYAVTGGLELPHVDGATMKRLATVRALLVNAAEATALSGRSDPEAAARDLARQVSTAVVTLGADGALAVEDGQVTRASAPRVVERDATGAGDLFAAAYVWADLCGASPGERLAWSSLYAALSVRAPTAFSGALREEELLAEGRARGLVPPGGLGKD